MLKFPQFDARNFPPGLSYEKLEFDFAVADGGRLEAAQEFRDQCETFTILAYLIERLD